MTRRKKPMSTKQRAIAAGYRSGLEQKIADQLDKLKEDYTYEELTLQYIKPETNHRYTPDFVLANGIIIESKGRFVSEDRKKHLLIQEQYPDLDIRFVFTNPNGKLYKGAKSTYADWCDKHGFKYATKLIPTEWIEE